MERSDSIAELAAAMARAEAKMQGAKRDSTNPFFGATYADLFSVREACVPALNSEGLAIWQWPRVSSEPDGQAVVEVETIVTHASGEWMGGTLKLLAVKTDAQAIGSLISYARRYALAAVCSVAAFDDDAESAMAHGAGARPAPHAPTPSDDPPGDFTTTRVAVKEVRQRPTANGGTKFTIVGRDGAKYGTFHRADAELARAAAKTGGELEIIYRATQYGNDVRSLAVVAEDLAQPEPPL